MFNLLYSLVLLAVVPLASPIEDIDFSKDILPIFRQHCFECHGNGTTEGELSLDSLTGILQGGHTSSPLLATPLSDSELYLRITSLSDGYKMPKDGESLSQQEIATIGNWISQVAIQDNDTSKKPASSKPVASTPAAAGSSSPSRARAGKKTSSGISAILEDMQPDQVATFLIGSAFLVVLLSWVLYKLTLGRPHTRRMSADGDRVMAFLSMVLGALSMLMLLGMTYLHWRNGQLFDENESLRTQLQEINPYGAAPFIQIDESNLPLPPHPMHPPRLGGKYYRGNDERNDRLFNQGFYRTATVDLHIVNPSGQRLQWNDEAGDNLEIEIQIQRAPKATRELFTERVRSLAKIEHYSQGDEGGKALGKNLTFDAVEEEQHWKARIPLPPRDKWSDGKTQGMVYVMFGVQPGEGQKPRPHFGIRYDLTLQDGKISKDSVLWMGSMYTLGNRVLVPNENKILLDRWFDWRPIPIIEGEASADPELLGVDDHSGH